MANYVVGQSSKVVIHAGKATEAIVRGLNSLTPPIGWSSSFTSIAEFGVPVDIQVATGLQYETVSCSGNFTLKDPTQAYLRQCSLNATQITDLRFYLDANAFVALDLISNPSAYYQVGSIAPPAGEKSGVYSFSVDFAPAGPSTLFENYISCSGMAFTADAGTGPTVEDTADGFVEAGFAVGQVCYLDKFAALDPIMLKIKTVTAGVITFEPATGGSASITTISGGASCKLSSGEPMAFTA